MTDSYQAEVLVAVHVGTVTRPTPHSSGPSVSRGSEVPADPDLSGSGAAPSLRGGRAVESPPDRDPLDQDPMLDDTARSGTGPNDRDAES